MIRDTFIILTRSNCQQLSDYATSPQFCEVDPSLLSLFHLSDYRAVFSFLFFAIDREIEASDGSMCSIIAWCNASSGCCRSSSATISGSVSARLYSEKWRQATRWNDDNKKQTQTARHALITALVTIGPADDDGDEGVDDDDDALSWRYARHLRRPQRVTVSFPPLNFTFCQNATFTV